MQARPRRRTQTPQTDPADAADDYAGQTPQTHVRWYALQNPNSILRVSGNAVPKMMKPARPRLNQRQTAILVL